MGYNLKLAVFILIPRRQFWVVFKSSMELFDFDNLSQRCILLALWYMNTS